MMQHFNVFREGKYSMLMQGNFHKFFILNCVATYA